jgi:hypothetical protein
MALSPLSPSALNAKHTGHSPLFDLAVPILKMVNGVVPSNKIHNDDDDVIHWDDGGDNDNDNDNDYNNDYNNDSDCSQDDSQDDSHHYNDHEPSSPFVTLLPDDKRPVTSSIPMSTFPELGSSPSPQNMSPDKVSAPFDICEDHTASMSMSPAPPLSTSRFRPSPSKHTQARRIVQQESHTSSHTSVSSSSSSGGATAMQFQEHRSHTMRSRQSSQVVQQGDHWPGDTTALTFVTAGEADNVDDTCFSAFSEVANVDMTGFAQLNGRSPTKSFNLIDQASISPVVRPQCPA